MTATFLLILKRLYIFFMRPQNDVKEICNGGGINSCVSLYRIDIDLYITNRLFFIAVLYSTSNISPKAFCSLQQNTPLMCSFESSF